MRVNVPWWAEDAVSDFLLEDGVAGLQVEGEERGISCLVVYLSGPAPLASLQGRLGTYLHALEEIHGARVDLGWEVDEIQEEAWRDAWKAHFHAARVSGRLVVKPTWEAFDPPPGSQVLEIDPGLAFGTGLHATTRLCLQWLDELLATDPLPSPLAGAGGAGGGVSFHRALDIGTGTGILAMAMAKLGVGEIWALDTDPLAVEAARENVRLNGVGDRIIVLEGSLERLEGRLFPLIVANLTGAALKGMAEALFQCVSANGTLLLSGILEEERASVREAFEQTGLSVMRERFQGEWWAMILRRDK